MAGPAAAGARQRVPCPVGRSWGCHRPGGTSPAPVLRGVFQEPLASSHPSPSTGPGTCGVPFSASPCPRSGLWWRESRLSAPFCKVLTCEIENTLPEQRGTAGLGPHQKGILRFSPCLGSAAALGDRNLGLIFRRGLAAKIPLRSSPRPQTPGPKVPALPPDIRHYFTPQCPALTQSSLYKAETGGDFFFFFGGVGVREGAGEEETPLVCSSLLSFTGLLSASNQWRVRACSSRPWVG